MGILVEIFKDKFIRKEPDEKIKEIIENITSLIKGGYYSLDIIDNYIRITAYTDGEYIEIRQYKCARSYYSIRLVKYNDLSYFTKSTTAEFYMTIGNKRLIDNMIEMTKTTTRNKKKSEDVIIEYLMNITTKEKEI